ncbi:hypothetical protein MVEN_01637600 [Mycena venus]|uniref:Uncharacterized protein n=1 Tax=Mycena venus TaxID=2733690 RepID=A0A8H6XQQ2_9AGAR|nr:hypothetical protein MVEN_01637600 [Mycena venus]
MALMHRDQIARERQMQLVLGSSSTPAPGRTLNQFYTHFGNYVEKRVNHAAHSWGRGPSATAGRIAELFGAEQHRAAKLDQLHNGASFPELEKECSKLIEYALPYESAGTQIQAFKCIVTTVTRVNATSDAIALRYLSGILELPTFWRGSGPTHTDVFSKILDHLIHVLKDLGLESDEDETSNGIIFDNEGIDSFASAILIGVSSWCPAEPETQYWYHCLAEIVRLLRSPEVEPLLPKSATLATGPDIRSIIRDNVPKPLNILVP